MDHRGRARRIAGVVTTALALSLPAAGVAGSGARAQPARTSPAVAGTGTARALTSTGGPLELLPLHSVDRRIVDSAGRDVLLRGANINSLAEYWQGVPTLPTTIDVTTADWDRMAARGFSVVRLLITWSRVEPTRGVIDQSYLDRVDAAVRQAASRGIYTVIDMHQDAYSAFIHTSDPGSCPAGTSPAKGWDGAPAWATLTDGLSTCLRGGDRNSSPAVERAWNNFYDNVDGIQTRFVSAWAAVATRFAGRAEVAGYDLLNEPEVSRPASELQPLYDQLLADTISAIRAAESAAPFDHLVFVEPAIPAGDPSRGLVIPSPAALDGDTTNISASVHNYMESIGNQLTLEAMNDLIESITLGLGVGNWGGEYGFWDTRPETLAVARRYAADEDDHLWGGAWWQWRQSCGDPHSVQWNGTTVVAPTEVSTHLNLLGCPANADLGANDAFLDILGRGYPRATPGRLTNLTSDVDSGHMDVSGSAPSAGGRLVVWSPTPGSATHPVSVVGLSELTEYPVPGGRIITAVVARAGDYRLTIEATDQTSPPPTAPTTFNPPTSTTEPTGPTTTTVGTTEPRANTPAGPVPPARPSQPRVADPSYTG